MSRKELLFRCRPRPRTSTITWSISASIRLRPNPKASHSQNRSPNRSQSRPPARIDRATAPGARNTQRLVEFLPDVFDALGEQILGDLAFGGGGEDFLGGGDRGVS